MSFLVVTIQWKLNEDYRIPPLVLNRAIGGDGNPDDRGGPDYLQYRSVMMFAAYG